LSQNKNTDYTDIDYALRRGVAKWGKWGHTSWTQGRGQKNFQRGVNAKKYRIIAKKDRKIALSSLFQGGGNEKKSKKKQKNTEK